MKKKQRIHYAICVVIALVVFTVGLFTQGMPDKIGTKEAVRVLSDSFLFSGVLLGGIGALSFIASMGTFDMLRYGVSSFIGFIVHPKQSRQGYYEYTQERAEKTGNVLLPELIVGIVCIIASAVCAVIYG